MIRYMLDTNTCILVIKDRPEAVCNKLSVVSVGEVGISSIVAAELWYGVAYSQKKKQKEAALKDFLEYVEIIAWPSEAGLWADSSRVEKEREPHWGDGSVDRCPCRVLECSARNR